MDAADAWLMRIEWSDAAGTASARRFMRDDQDGLLAVGLAILALADDPYPAEAFCRAPTTDCGVGAPTGSCTTSMGT